MVLEDELVGVGFNLIGSWNCSERGWMGGVWYGVSSVGGFRVEGMG